MPEVEIKAGARVNFLTSKELRAELDEFRRDLVRQMRRGPIPRTLTASVILDAAGAGTVDLGAPALGDAWDVRRVNVTPQDPTAAAMAAVVVIWRGQAFDPFRYVDRNIGSPNIPAVSTWSSRQLTLRQDEKLWISVTGGTAAAVVVCSAQVLEGTPADIYGRELS